MAAMRWWCATCSWTGASQVLAAVTASGTVTWDLADRLGSVTDVVNFAGTTDLDRVTFDAYGNFTETNAAAGDVYKWEGGRYDVPTGLTLFGMRYYDAAAGVWTTPDPSGFAGGQANFYQYVGNNPTNATDPTGLLQWKGSWLANLIDSPRTTAFLQQAGPLGNLLASFTNTYQTVTDAQRYQDQHGFSWFNAHYASFQFHTPILRIAPLFREMQGGVALDARAYGTPLTGSDYGARSLQIIGDLLLLVPVGRGPGQTAGGLGRPVFALAGSGGRFGGSALALEGNGSAANAAILGMFTRSISMALTSADNAGGSQGAGDDSAAGGGGNWGAEGNAPQHPLPRATDLRLSGTVEGHLTDVVGRGPFRGELARPFTNNRLLMQEIMDARPPVPDPQGVPGALRWDVPGTFRGSNGTWELVVDTNTNTVLHFNFVGGR